MKTRKELNEEYKQKKYKMGVFCIRNTANGKVYIGSSLDLVAIWHAQKFQLNAGMHANEELQKDWIIYGAEVFMYEIIDVLKENNDPNVDYNRDLKALEELVIEEIQPFDSKGYNKIKRVKS